MTTQAIFVGILEANAVIIALWAFYAVVLRTGTHYHYSRIFLLSIALVGVGIAAINIEVERAEVVASTPTFLSLSDAFPAAYVGEDLSLGREEGMSSFVGGGSAFQWITWILLIGAFLSLLFAIFRWVAFYSLLRKQRTWNEDHQVYLIQTFDVAFAFLGTIYLPRHYMAFPADDLNRILAHERGHAALRHHWDRITLSFFKAMFWYNPAFILIDRSLTAVHEFQVDRLVVTPEEDPFAYSNLLLRLQSGVHPPTMAALFSKQLIKSRVNRLHQPNSTIMKKVTFMLALPLVATLFYAFSIQTVAVPLALPTGQIEPMRPDPHQLPIAASTVTGFSAFGARIDPFSSETTKHRGIDLVAPSGTPILASMAGTVLSVQYLENGYGNLVEILHANGSLSRYAHLLESLVVSGQAVNQGEVIGSCGSTGKSTGPHLHFELLHGDSLLDPEEFIDLGNISFAKEEVLPPMKKDLKVIIDAGHGGKDPGNQAENATEKDITMAISKVLALLLRSQGYEVVETRNGDDFVPLTDRVGMSHSNSDELLISLHLNASENDNARGVEMFIPTEAHPYHDLSKHFGNEVGRVLNEEAVLNRGMKTAEFYVLKQSTCPSILVELGFMSSPLELKRLTSEAYQLALAEYLSQGISYYAR
ncbi:MAG: N-acetylmuramoyl-L-alanine amidase [Flavobacteriales bacterium]|nr:N-acetylmuramoyl-L-alanine amidase [Flavobacteriales bacterium]